MSQEELAIALARAEQAEHSLAASERALAALRYQAQAGGCELSTVGENFYHCRADALCGLCRLRHRAEQAERDRDAWREKWEALETTRAVCCAQIERERDEARATNRDNLAMWEVERDALKAKLAEAERENLTLRNRIGIDRTSWHEAEAEVKVLRAKLAKTERERDDAMTLAEERRDYARAQNAKLSVECDDLRAQLTAVERERDEARAERDTLGRRVEDAQAALNECGAGFTGQKESTRIRALRARLAKTERVVEAAMAWRRVERSAEGVGSASASRALSRQALILLSDLRRALDSPVGAGTDSGGSGAAQEVATSGRPADSGGGGDAPTPSVPPIPEPATPRPPPPAPSSRSFTKQ